MRNSNLAILAQTVNTAVAHELGELVKDETALADIAPERHRYVAGLRVVSNAARDAATDPNAAKLFRGLNQFRTDAKILKDRLARAGVTPIVLLPLAAWERLCDRTKLYRFKPDQGGQVRISSKALDEAKLEADTAKVWAPSPGFALLVISVMIGLAVWLHRLHSQSDIMTEEIVFIIIGIMGSFFGTLITMLVLDTLRDDERKTLVEPILRSKIEAANKDGSIYGLLWPDCHEPKMKRVNATVRITLPEPPGDVQETLVAAERDGIPLLLAVVGDAIVLREDPGDALMAYRKRKLEEEARARAPDPIVYAVEGAAVAVIAQYGDFPIEQEVINEVVNSVYLA